MNNSLENGARDDTRTGKPASTDLLGILVDSYTPPISRDPHRYARAPSPHFTYPLYDGLFYKSGQHASAARLHDSDWVLLRILATYRLVDELFACRAGRMR